MKKLIQSVLKSFGYRLQSLRDSVIDADVDFALIYKKCKPYTMTPRERMYALYQAVKYVTKANISGDFVECGVWKGGSIMVIAETLLSLGISDRRIWLYDTFEGMPEPTKEDVHTENNAIMDYQPSVGTMTEVMANIASTGYPERNFVLCQGKVEDTLLGNLPNSISLLRLDTDWYESTKHEMENLYPKLSQGGVLIIDDYGAWAGAKKAVDDYGAKILLNRIDHDSRLGIKI